MTISTKNLISIEKYLRLMRANSMLTEDGEELLKLVQDELVRRVNNDLAYWHFYWKVKELRKKGNSVTTKLLKKKAHKIMIPIKKAHKIRYGVKE